MALLREQAEAPNATRILYRNVYGWFEPAGRGLYRITEEGVRGLEAFAGDAVVAEPAVLVSIATHPASRPAWRPSARPWPAWSSG